MLSSPMQNQDMLQRSEALSEMRNLEQNKTLGDLSHAAALMRQKEARKGASVQKAEESGLDPDANQGRSQERQQNQLKPKVEGEEDTSHDHPHRLAGGEHLDILA